jgi:hypothetical protein
VEAFKEKAVGFLLVAGLVICAISGIAAFMFVGGGVFHATYTRTPGTDAITDVGDLQFAPVAGLFFVIGLSMIGGGIAFALKEHKMRHVGQRETVEFVRILARYGFTRNWTMVTDWELEQTENPYYYVRAEVGPGEILELECSPQVYYSCGEGMTGQAEIQGKWLGKFIPYIGTPQQPSA